MILCDNSHIRRFEFFYFFVMVVYMAQMTSETARMIGGLSSPWLPFLIPVVLTLILLSRNRVSFNDNKLISLLCICLIWHLIVTFYKGLYTTADQSFQFFLFYAIIDAFIHVKVFGRKIIPLYETIMVIFCKIALPLWLISLLAPSLTTQLASYFPETVQGHNILYIYNFINVTDPNGLQYLRNAGCSWEPGRFAIMVVLAIYCNITRNGVRFKNNKNIYWLLATLLSTMSTTGYSIVILIYTITLLHGSSIIRKILSLIILLPIIFYLFSLDFMGAKISEQLNVSDSANEKFENMDYYNGQYGQGEYAASLGRFEAMYFEWENILHDPIVGYSRNPAHSYFYNNISSNFGLTGGILKIFGMYGLILGTFFYLLLFYSSVRIASYHRSPKILLFLVIVLSSVSYEVFVVPIFTAFWLFGLFGNPKGKRFVKIGNNCKDSLKSIS